MNTAAAVAGISGASLDIRSIQLVWGNDLNVDVLSADLAVVGVSWSEVRMMSDGRRIADAGYFTGVVEREGAAWKFRDAHWSEPLPAQ